jgi:hypothetical protein
MYFCSDNNVNSHHLSVCLSSLSLLCHNSTKLKRGQTAEMELFFTELVCLLDKACLFFFLSLLMFLFYPTSHRPTFDEKGNYTKREEIILNQENTTTKVNNENKIKSTTCTVLASSRIQ